MRRDIVDEVKYTLYHAFLGLFGLSFVGYHLTVVFTGMKYHIN